MNADSAAEQVTVVRLMVDAFGTLDVGPGCGRMDMDGGENEHGQEQAQQDPCRKLSLHIVLHEYKGNKKSTKKRKETIVFHNNSLYLRVKMTNNL